VLAHINEDLTFTCNPEEVEETRWISKDDLIALLEVGQVTPWFRLISEKFLLGINAWDACILRDTERLSHIFSNGQIIKI